MEQYLEYETMVFDKFRCEIVALMRRDSDNQTRWEKILNGTIAYRTVKLPNLFPALLKIHVEDSLDPRCQSPSTRKGTGRIFRAIFNDFEVFCQFFSHLPGNTYSALQINMGPNSSVFICPKAEVTSLFSPTDFQPFKTLYALKKWQPIFFQTLFAVGQRFLRVYEGASNPQVFVLRRFDIRRRGDLDVFYEVLLANTSSEKITISPGILVRGEKGVIPAKWLSFQASKNPTLYYARTLDELVDLKFSFQPSLEVEGVIQVINAPTLDLEGKEEEKDSGDDGSLYDSDMEEKKNMS